MGGRRGLAVLARPLGDLSEGLRIVKANSEPPGHGVWIGFLRDPGRLRRLRAFVDPSI